jgi:phosphoribosylanthranilate isomerase
MIVKICGIRTLDEALAATRAGADMLGFNFYPSSPRFIDPQSCKSLIHQLRSLAAGKDAEPGVLPLLVGVFVNRASGEVSRLLDACGLDLAQLSGDEGLADMTALEGRAFKAIRPRDLAEAGSLARAYRSHLWSSHGAPAVLLDSSAADAPGAALRPVYGGSGQPSDWLLAQALAKEMPLLLAGGLKPENVAQAIEAVRPWGVDVASGVECRPGTKDPDKMAAFIRIAKAMGK